MPTLEKLKYNMMKTITGNDNSYKVQAPPNTEPNLD